MVVSCPFRATASQTGHSFFKFLLRVCTLGLGKGGGSELDVSV